MERGGCQRGRNRSGVSISPIEHESLDPAPAQQPTAAQPLGSVDALVLFSFGGPEGPGDVFPFLRNVTAGRNIPDERLAVVAEQYARFGGRSPLNQLNRDLIARIEQDLAANGLDLPVYFGNRHWHPFIGQTLDKMVADGVQHAAVFVTSAFGSRSGCRQYVDALDAEAERLGARCPRLDKLRLYYDHPSFLNPTIDALRDALAQDPSASVVFTAHSIPNAMAASSPYERQLRSAAATVLAKATPADQALGRSVAVDLAFQSRSGPPSVPWLEPDINDRIVELAKNDASHVIIVPLGFVSDHMEVRFDLDTQAAESAANAGLRFTRLATPGTSDAFAKLPRKLLEERYQNTPPNVFAPDAGGALPTACGAIRCGGARA